MRGFRNIFISCSASSDFNSRKLSKKAWSRHCHSLTLALGFQQTVKNSRKSDSQKLLTELNELTKVMPGGKCGAGWLTIRHPVSIQCPV